MFFFCTCKSLNAYFWKTFLGINILFLKKHWSPKFLTPNAYDYKWVIYVKTFDLKKKRFEYKIFANKRNNKRCPLNVRRILGRGKNTAETIRRIFAS